VVCHRGVSVDSGHYVALVRSNVSTKGSEEEMSQWLRFDDLASQRVSLVDIQQALKEETPYLLFYQILPVDGDPGNLTSGEKPPPGYSASTPGPAKSDVSSTGEPLIAVSSAETQPASGRPSMDIESSEDGRGRASDSADRRPSTISFTQHMPTPETSSVDVDRDQAPVLEHKKSASFSDGLGKTFSKLASRSKKSSKEDLPSTNQAVQMEGDQYIHIEELPMPTRSDSVAFDIAESRTDPGPPLPTTHHQHHQAGTPAGVGRSRSRREKSRSRLLKPGKSKQGPDRECIVM